MNKRIIGLSIIAILLLSSISVISAADEDRSYSIEKGDIILTVGSLGDLYVSEFYQYKFDGEFNGVYRDIPLKPGESISNINITVDGAYFTYKVLNFNESTTIRVYLYSDEAHTQPIKDTTVTINYNYIHDGVVKIYNDVGELQYKLWGEEWDVDVDSLTAMVQFNSSEGIEYWINPYFLKSSETWDGSILTINTGKLESGEYLELRSIIPLNQFANETPYAKIVHENGYETIHKIQDDYENSIKFNETLYAIIPILLLLSLIIPLRSYLKHGREPKIDYIGEYEREPPSDLPPLFVNAMFGKDDDVGYCSDKGFQAVIMDLIDRGIIEINGSEDNLIFKIKYENVEGLEEYEIKFLAILERYAEEGEVSLKEMTKKLKNRTEADIFEEIYKDTVKSYEKEYVKPELEKYFDNEGHDQITMYALILIVASIIVIIIAMFSSPQVPMTVMARMIALGTVAIGVILLTLNNRYGGKWTKYGREESKKWENFSKFLKDFSLIKEHPPQSVVIWNKYLIYATALGDAKAVEKAMKELSPENYQYNDLYRYNHYHGGRAFSTVMSTASSHSTSGSDGAGGVGGGSGGGGGGAF